ncbi:hypothetical protein [Pseudazoarcus pumilus]|uniref:hypothetical protein n=1 Tax=Pseudazoarcus pumilus TaxID=2067960 RepID=UPI000F51168C|nr:hypothetical protein [Pseudazoarcus pumilus]
MLAKLLNWFFNNLERRFGLHTGRDSPPAATRECASCGGEGVLAETGDVCPSCHGSGRDEAGSR